MAMIARTMLRSSPAAYMGVRAMSTEIPINSVARVVRCAAAHSRHPPRPVRPAPREREKEDVRECGARGHPRLQPIAS